MSWLDIWLRESSVRTFVQVGNYGQKLHFCIFKFLMAHWLHICRVMKRILSFNKQLKNFINIHWSLWLKGTIPGSKLKSWIFQTSRQGILISFLIKKSCSMYVLYSGYIIESSNWSIIKYTIPKTMFAI